MADLTTTSSAISPEDVKKLVWGNDAIHTAELVDKLSEEHNDWHEHSLNLVASHNIVSPRVKALLGSDLAQNIAGGDIGARDHTGNVLLDRIETGLVELAKRLFGANHVEIRAPSGATANGIFIFGAMDPYDRIMAVPPIYGGHHTYWHDSYAGLKGLDISEIPHTDDEYPTIDLELLAIAVECIKPKWLVLGTATLLFPYPMAEISEIAKAAGARIFYDGAHILGLAAGGQFQNPILEGAAAMTGSTQKTLPGPVGGLILMQDEDIADRVAQNTRLFISNYNNSRTAALAIALAEMVAFGKEYASAVVKNAQALARALDHEGFKVVGKNRGFTQSHIVLVDITDMANQPEILNRLEAARITCSQMELRHTTPERTVLRLGTSACARRGMGEAEMIEAARLIRRVVDKEDPAVVERDVIELASGFTTVRYCF